MLSVAFEMFRQLPPPTPQRRHWYEKSIGVDPDQVPGSAFSVCPSCAVPEMVGGEVLLGAVAVDAPADLLSPTSAAVASSPQTTAAGTSLEIRFSCKRMTSSSGVVALPSRTFPG